MIEFLAQIPSDTMIFITTLVLGLAATLLGLKWLIQAAIKRADRSPVVGSCSQWLRRLLPRLQTKSKLSLPSR
jgi:hypothetical protein